VASGSVAKRLAQVRALRGAKKLAEAQSMLEELPAADRDDPRVEVERIAILIARHDPQARTVAQGAVERWPKAAGCWIALAEAALKATPVDAPAAATAARQALSLSPRDRVAHLQLARAERARGRLADALEAVRAGLRGDPRDATLLGLEGEILRQLGRGAEAARAAEAMPEGTWKARQKLDASLTGLSPDEAESELAALAALEPGRVEVHERLGTLRYKARRFAEAAQSLLRALEIEPDNAYLRRMAGYACSKSGDAARAAAVLRSLFVENPLDDLVRATFVYACRRTNDVPGLRAAIDEALARHPHAKMLYGIRRRFAPDLPVPLDKP
jgi:predicted Zn-dependent protease